MHSDLEHQDEQLGHIEHQYKEGILMKLYKKNAVGKKGLWWLGTISFTESSFFPVPPDPFLMATLLVHKKPWWWLSLFVAITSVLGGLFGYLIGFAFFEIVGQPLVDFYNLHEELAHMKMLFEENALITLFTAAFTPVPFKLFTIASGLFNINVVLFIIATIIGRSARFLIVGYIMHLFGERIGRVVFKYFNLLLMLLVVLVAIFLVYKFL